MKKMNKKGFTLAELLIVIAIIAILIAIAIPTFSGALENAKLQTDHANIRSAYAMVMSANMLGGIDTDGDGDFDTAPATLVFQKDGTLKEPGAAGAAPYELQASPKTGDCNASVGCNSSSQYVDHTNSKAHTKGGTITITYAEGVGFQLVLTEP